MPIGTYGGVRGGINPPYSISHLLCMIKMNFHLDEKS